jgi:hypothetical protein
MPKELDTPDIPEVLQYLMDWWQSLSLSRTNNGFGNNPLQYSEIEAWCRINGIKMERWELSCIRAIDIAYLTAMAKAKD